MVCPGADCNQADDRIRSSARLSGADHRRLWSARVLTPIRQTTQYDRLPYSFGLAPLAAMSYTANLARLGYHCILEFARLIQRVFSPRPGCEQNRCKQQNCNFSCVMQVKLVASSVAGKSKLKRRSGCPVSISLEIFGDRWSLLIIRDLMVRGYRTFKEFQESGEGIATNILADRLQKLEASESSPPRPRRRMPAE